MGAGISRMAKQELLATVRDRYQESSKKANSRILDKFIAVTGHHRKHGIRLLAQTGYDPGKSSAVKGRRIYDEAVRETVIVTWEAADRICGKRRKADCPTWWSPWSDIGIWIWIPRCVGAFWRPASPPCPLSSYLPP